MPPEVAQSWTDFRSSLRICVFGTIWGAVGGLGPTLIDAWYNYQTYTDAVDWGQLIRIFTVGAITGAVMYWRKHTALFKLPPWFKDVPLSDHAVAQINAVAKKEGQEPVAVDEDPEG